MNENNADALREKYTNGKYFIRVPAWINYGAGIDSMKGAELKIFVCLCSRMSKTNSATISREDISSATGITLSSISGIIHSLVISGYIAIEKEGRNNIYYINFTPPGSWPLHRPINSARIKAAKHRRAVLYNNTSNIADITGDTD